MKRLVSKLKRPIALGLSTLLLVSAFGVPQALAAGGGEQIIDASRKAAMTPMAEYLSNGMTKMRAQQLLAQGEYDTEALVLKIRLGSNEQDLVKTYKSGQVVQAEEIISLPAAAGIDKAGTWYKLTLENVTDMAGLMAELSQGKTVQAVEPDYIMQVSPVTTSEAQDRVTSSSQYYLNDYGIQEGWDYLKSKNVKPGKGVVVAVVDTGVDYNHPDLQANILRTADGSVWGYDFVNLDNDPIDDNMHGTHVAGIIAAADNDFGVTGISPEVKIMPVKVLDGFGSGSMSGIVEGVKYAGAQGADIINMSLGGGELTQIETDAMDLMELMGVLVVAAAGNESMPSNKLPNETEYSVSPFGSINNVVGVMATAEKPAENGDQLVYFSNWDPTLYDTYGFEMMAPGENILSTEVGGGYLYANGTSMASPAATGMAANLLSYINQYGVGGNTTLTKVEKRNYLFSQMAGTGELAQGITVNNKTYSFPRADMYEMLTATPKPQVGLVEYTDSIIGNFLNTIFLDFANFSGTAKDVKVELKPLNSGVTVQRDLDKFTLVDAESQTLSFTVNADESVANNTNLKFDLAVEYKNGKDNKDTKTYKLNQTLEVYYSAGQYLTQDLLDKSTTLDSSKSWIIKDPLVLKAGQNLEVTQGAELVFTGKGSLQVAGNLKLVGTLYKPVLAYGTGSYAIIEQVDSGRVDADYAIFYNPMLVATNLKHADFQGYNNNIVIADKIEYCNIGSSLVNIKANSMNYCQLMNYMGNFQVKQVENSVIYPIMSLELSDGELDPTQSYIQEFTDVSYSLDLSKLKPVVQSGQVYIAYPTAGDEKVNQFIMDYVALLGGKLTKAVPETAGKEGALVAVDLGTTDQAQLDAMYNSKVWGDKSTNGFNGDFYKLLQKLNSFKNNALLGFANFTAPATEKQRYQLLMDNYVDISNDFMTTYYNEGGNFPQEIVDYYTNPKNMMNEKNTTYVYTALKDAPKNIPPFQVKISSTTAPSANGYLDKSYGRIKITADFNTTVVNRDPVVVSYTSLYQNNESISGSWLNQGSTSSWRGDIYSSPSSNNDMNLYDVSWTEDPWMTVEFNNRQAIHDDPIMYLDRTSKHYGGKESIIIKGAVNSGIYYQDMKFDIYRSEYGKSDKVKLNSQPLGITQGNDNQPKLVYEDKNVQKGVAYIYEFMPVTGKMSRELKFISALNDRENLSFSLKQQEESGKVTATILNSCITSLDWGNSYQFKVYYPEGMTFTKATLSKITDKDILNYSLGKDTKGNYLLLSYEAARNKALYELSGIIDLEFAGRGELSLEQVKP